MTHLKQRIRNNAENIREFNGRLNEALLREDLLKREKTQHDVQLALYQAEKDERHRSYAEAERSLIATMQALEAQAVATAGARHARPTDDDDEPEYLGRNSRVRIEFPPEEEPEGEIQCGICLMRPLEPVVSRCGSVRCSFETCKPCWTNCMILKRECPQCRLKVRHGTMDDSSESDDDDYEA
jgi:hypothetical protein